MPRVFIGVGSNIDPQRNIKEALSLLRRRVRLVGISTFYRTEPHGRPDQHAFYNGVVEVETDIPPAELKRSVLQPIEEQLGRERTEDRYAPRTMDLDLLVYGDLVTTSDELTLPDPQITQRPFLAVPLAELAPDLALPGSGVPLQEIASALSNHDMKPLPDYTALLRGESQYGLRED